MIQEPLFTKFQNSFGGGNSVTSITHLHKEIHDGSAYKVCFTSSAATSGSVIYLQINGSSSYEGHLKSFRLHASEAFVDVKFIELSTDSTHTTGSAGLTVYNKNRRSSNLTNLEFFSDPTDVSSTASDNVIIDRFQIGGTGGSNRTPAANQELGQQDEWIIGNSTYVLEITSLTTAASFWLNGCLTYYEEVL